MTTKETCNLINLLKEICSQKKLNLPHYGEKMDFRVKAIENNTKFIINVNHCNINPNKYTFQSRMETANTPLLRLDVSPNGVHQNPDGSKIYGTHLHIYDEENELSNTILFDINNPNVYDYCMEFFKKFNILDKNNVIIYQEELGGIL